MLRPTVYIPSRELCLTKARWLLAQASLEAMVAQVRRETDRAAVAAVTEAAAGQDIGADGLASRGADATSLAAAVTD